MTKNFNNALAKAKRDAETHNYGSVDNILNVCYIYCLTSEEATVLVEKFNNWAQHTCVRKVDLDAVLNNL